MPERTHLIHSITFRPDGDVVIEFLVPRDDVKANGLMLQHAMVVPAGDDYDDEIEDLVEAAQALLLDTLEDHQTLPAFELPVPDPDEDDDDEEDDD